MAQVASLLDESLVEVRDLTVRFGAHVALDRVSLTLERGRVMAVVGANGAGKSTLFRALLGLVPIEEGELRLLGRPAQLLTPRDRLRVAYVSELHAELAHAHISDLVRQRRAFYPAFDLKLFRDLTRELSIPDSATVGSLSRGQRALTVVGLALAQQPDLLLLDDPTLGLDPLSRRRVVQGLMSATRDRAVTILFASHELDDIERVADDVLLLARGKASLAIETDTFVADAGVLRLPPAVDRAAAAAIPGVLWSWPRRACLEVVVRGDAGERADAEAALGDLAGERVRCEPVSFQDLALAWLASDRGAS